LQADQLEVKKMLRDEESGLVATYSFKSRHFQKLPVTATSGRQGTGSHVGIISQYLTGSETELRHLQSDLLRTEADVKEAGQTVQEARTKFRTALESLTRTADESAQRMIEENEAVKKTVYASADQDIKKRANELEAGLTRLRADYAVAREPITGQSYDLMEQTEALHDLALGRHGVEGGSKQTTILWLIILILICLMFIDLSPLFMKLMRPAGAYERWKAMAAAGTLPPELGLPDGGLSLRSGPPPRPKRTLPPQRPNGR
jgi:hypothetical protein